MAVRASIYHPWQAPLECAVCEGHNDVSKYCLDCKGSLCTECETNHKRIPISKHHAVVSITEGLRRKSLEQESCAIHPSLQYSLHCEDCTTLVCTECVIRDHTGHKLGSIQEAVVKVLTETEKYSKSMKEILGEFRLREKEVDENNTQCLNWYTDVKRQVNETRDKLVAEVNQVCNGLISKAEKEKKRKIANISQSKEKIQDGIEQINELMTSSGNVFAKSNSEKMKLMERIRVVTSIRAPTLESLHLPPFVGPSDEDMSLLLEQIRTLGNKSKSEEEVANRHIHVLDTHKHGSQRIYNIYPISGQEAWVNSADSNKLQLVKTSGKVAKTVKCKSQISQFIITPSGDIITSEHNPGCIKIVSQKGNISKSFKTDSWNPTGLCLTNSTHDIVVCMTKSNSLSALKVYSMHGDVLQSIDYSSKAIGKYTSQRVTQNKNDDFCIVHQGHHCLYVIDSEGTLRFTYDESATDKMNAKFTPVDVCCDSHSNILITDCFNRAIHILDKDGDVLRYVQEELPGIGEIRGIEVDPEGKIWVGHGDGYLSTVRYLC